jgi:hypothetical protein
MPALGQEETFGNSCNARDQDQFLAVSRRRAAEITVLCLDREAAALEQMIKLPAIGPAERHLARVLREHLAVGPDFGVVPEIVANLVEVIETGSENLTRIAAPGLRMRAGKLRLCDVRIDQQIETRIKHMQDQPASRLEVAVKGLQRLSLQVDRQEVLERAGRARRRSQNAGPNSADSCPDGSR